MKIFVSAGEVSGDVHGSYLVRALKLPRPDIQFYGIGSDRLAAEGVEIKFDLIRRGTIGLLEALPNLFPLYRIFSQVKKLLRREKPDLVILIDSQGFNMPLANFCKKNGIKTVYYIAPQEWLWGTPKGVKKVTAAADLIVAIFEKEYTAYRQAGANVVYFGHPLLDIARPSASREETRRRLIGPDVHPSTPVISLCPGSRLQEIKALLPVLLKAGELIKKEMPDARFIMPVASQQIFNEIFSWVETLRPKAIVGDTYNLLYASDLNICTSGTINLESSILGVPNIMVYKLSALTYFIGKYILRITDKLPYFSMPNLILNERVIPELVMADANPSKVASEALALLKDPARTDQMKDKFFQLRTHLGNGGAIQKTAEKILGMVS